jgi:hypothetical protein
MTKPRYRIIRKDGKDVIVDEAGNEHPIEYIRDPSMDTDGHQAHRIRIPTLEPKDPDNKEQS